MIITNKHKTAVGLPGGQVLQPGVPTDVRDWDRVSKNHVIAAWVKYGVLAIGGAAPIHAGEAVIPAEGAAAVSEPDTAEPAAEEEDDKERMIRALAGHGVKADRRWSEQRLSDTLAELEG